MKRKLFLTDIAKEELIQKRRNIVSGIGDIITKPGNIYYDPPVIENVVRSLRRALRNRNYDFGNFTYALVNCIIDENWNPIALNHYCTYSELNVPTTNGERFELINQIIYELIVNDFGGITPDNQEKIVFDYLRLLSNNSRICNMDDRNFRIQFVQIIIYLYKVTRNRVTLTEKLLRSNMGMSLFCPPPYYDSLSGLIRFLDELDPNDLIKYRGRMYKFLRDIRKSDTEFLGHMPTSDNDAHPDSYEVDPDSDSELDDDEADNYAMAQLNRNFYRLIRKYESDSVDEIVDHIGDMWTFSKKLKLKQHKK
jgi:hypothetical protein